MSNNTNIFIIKVNNNFNVSVQGITNQYIILNDNNDYVIETLINGSYQATLGRKILNANDIGIFAYLNDRNEQYSGLIFSNGSITINDNVFRKEDTNIKADFEYVKNSNLKQTKLIPINGKTIRPFKIAVNDLENQYIILDDKGTYKTKVLLPGEYERNL